MNLPNKLTVLRMCLVPVFVALVFSTMLYNYLWALLVFAAASLTDLLDGRIARKHNLVTDFGKFMDPLADKILVMSAMLCFVQLGWASAAVVIVILAREFLVTSLRLIAAGKGTVIVADKWGKIKTVVQMAWIMAGLLAAVAGAPVVTADSDGLTAVITIVTGPIHLLTALRDVLMWLSVVITVISGFNYVWKNRACINQM